MTFALTAVTHPERATVARMIAALAEVFGEALTEVRIEGYLAALSDVPTEALRMGLQRAMKTARFFPKPAELRAAVDAELTAQRNIAGRVVEDMDPRVWVHCATCEDVGWVWVEAKSPTVRKCSCWGTNPKFAPKPQTYSEREERYR
jgi:hypothetical protein